MIIKPKDIEATIKEVEGFIKSEKELTPAFRSTLEMMLLIIKLLLNQLGLNSKNSSKPPSSDPNRKKTLKESGINKPGGQHGHKGKTLSQVEDPDEIVESKIDKRTLPKGRHYTFLGWKKRQVFEIQISRYVIEYRCEVVKDEYGNQFTAPFPNDVKQSTQYGDSLKASAVYMSMFQFIPYERLCDLFEEQFNTPLSAASLVSFNQQAFRNLDTFSKIVKHKLAVSDLLHVDETGINIGGKRYWVHNASNDEWTFFYPNKKRGKDAMDEIGILPNFHGTMVHDHWKPYYKFDCAHSLCNAHHIRELRRAFEQDEMKWALEMENFLKDLNKKVIDSGGFLEKKEIESWKLKYRKILESANQECPLPPPDKNKSPSRQKKSKSRNLLERLEKFEDDVLRFMTSKIVPFTNNMAERDIRMTKVQQKISGCFRSLKGAEAFCTIRSYISTCQKNNVCVTKALEDLFKGKYPEFIQKEIATIEKITE